MNEYQRGLLAGLEMAASFLDEKSPAKAYESIRAKMRELSAQDSDPTDRNRPAYQEESK